MAPFVAVVDSEQVRAAVTLALDGAMEAMVEEITGRVLAALQTKPSAGPVPEVEATKTEPANTPIMETVRRVSKVRARSTSILGLEPPPAGE